MKGRSSTKAFEKAADPLTGKVSLCLYIAGSSDRSIRALQNVKELCSEHLGDRYQLDVVDIHKQPNLAQADNVIAVPMLIKRRPPPPRRFVGDLSDREVVLAGLGLDRKRK